jgi:hypothetical protein
MFGDSSTTKFLSALNDSSVEVADGILDADGGASTLPVPMLDSDDDA